MAGFVNPYAPAAPSTSPEAPQGPTGFVNPYAGTETGGEGFSLGGLFGNVLSGIGDIAQGVVDILGSGVHDVAKLGAAVVPGEQPIERGGFQLDDMGKALVGFGPTGWDPAKYGITGDLWRRYSPLLPGGTPASETFTALYEEPVSFALDALTVATAGATAGAKFGASAIKGTSAAKIGADATNALKLAGFGSRAASRAGIRVAMDALAETRPLSALEELARASLPQTKYARVGNALAPRIAPLNPAMRPVANLVGRIGTEPVSALAGRVDDLRGVIDSELAKEGATLDDLGAVADATPTPALSQAIANYRVAKGLLDEAEARNLTRIATDRGADMAVGRVARRLAGELNADFIAARQARLKAVHDTLRPHLEAHPEIASSAAGLWQRLDLDIAGMDPAHWAASPIYESIGRRILDPDGGVPTELAIDIDPAVRAAVNPQFLSRTEALVTRLRAAKTKWLQDPQLEGRGFNIADETDSIDRMIDHLYDAVDRRVLADRGAGIDPGLIAMDDMRLLNLEQSAKLWETPGSLSSLSPRQMLDRAYLPLRAKYGAKAGLDGILEGGPDTKALDDMLRASGEAAPIYFPHIDPAEIGAWEFFRGKKPVGGARLAKDQNLLRNEAKLLERSSYMTDPMQAFSRRAIRAVRSEETYRTLMSYATRLGRKIDSPAELAAGEVLFAPQLARVAKRTAVRVQDLVDDMTSRGLTREESVWNAVKQVTEMNQDELAEAIAMAQGGQGLTLYAVPKAAADSLDHAAKMAGGFGPKGVNMFYDSAMQGWRQLTLFTRPAYVANQFLGNTAFSLLQGSGLRAPLEVLGRRGLQAIRRRLGGKVTDAALARLDDLPGYDELGTGFFGSMEFEYLPKNAAFARTRVGRAVARAGETKLASGSKAYMHAMKQAAVEIDSAYRVSGYISAAERALGVNRATRFFRRFQGLEKRIGKVLDGGFGDDYSVVHQALDEAKMFFGDYAAMGAMERHIVRRYFFPWWGFTRHNIQLMLRFPVNYPGRAELFNSLHNMNEEMLAQYGEIPPWMSSSIPLGPPGNEVTFFSMRGGSPFEGVFQPWTSQLAPLPKVAIERATGRNLFTGLEFSDPDVITPFGSDQPFRLIRDEAGNVINVEPVEGNVLPGLAEHLLRQLPPYSYAERLATADASTYGTATLADFLQGQGIMTDEAGVPYDQEGAAAVLSSYLGFPINNVDLASYQERLAREREAALGSAT